MSKVRPLSEAYAKVAETKLGETPERVEYSLAAVKQWLLQSPHIRARTEDQCLLAFLRGCKFSVERVKEKLDMYYTARSRMFSELVGRDPMDEMFRNLVTSGILTMLFLRDHSADDPALLLMRGCKFDPDIHSENDLFEHGVKIVEILLDEDKFTVSGVVVVVDLKDITTKQIVHLSPSFLKRMVTLFYRSAPLRVEGIYIVNVSPALVFFCNIFRSLLGEKLKNRVHIEKTTEDLPKYVPVKYLPNEYNGCGGSIDDLIEDSDRYVLSKRDILLGCQNYGVDETKRIVKSKFAERMNDPLEGSFRKLSVD